MPWDIRPCPLTTFSGVFCRVFVDVSSAEGLTVVVALLVVVVASDVYDSKGKFKFYFM